MSVAHSPRDPWLHLRRHSAARIALGRSGGSLPTREVLAFAHDHALARDAVHTPLDAEALADELRQFCPEVLVLSSAAPDRATYLHRPDLGRRLSDDSRCILEGRALARTLESQAPSASSELGPSGATVVIIVSDGLSACAAQRQAPLLLAALLPLLHNARFSLAPLCVVRHARVALQDEVGALLHARQSLILLGERPGLGTPDSLGAYLTFDPRPGRTDAERNCVSNIRSAGLPPVIAAGKIAALLIASRRQQLSGTGLNEDSRLLV